MSTYTDTFSPFLVSEVPAVSRSAAKAPRNGLWARLLEDLASRRDSRTFERAIRGAGYSEAHDLLAARRRD